jgi:hypothetical protein
MHDDIVTSSMSYKKEYNSKLGLIQYKRNVQLLIHASLIYHHKRKEKREEEEMKKKLAYVPAGGFFGAVIVVFLAGWHKVYKTGGFHRKPAKNKRNRLVPWFFITNRFWPFF